MSNYKFLKSISESVAVTDEQLASDPHAQSTADNLYADLIDELSLPTYTNDPNTPWFLSVDFIEEKNCLHYMIAKNTDSTQYLSFVLELQAPTYCTLKGLNEGNDQALFESDELAVTCNMKQWVKGERTIKYNQYQGQLDYMWLKDNEDVILKKLKERKMFNRIQVPNPIVYHTMFVPLVQAEEALNNRAV